MTGASLHDLAALIGGEVLREAHPVGRRGGDDQPTGRGGAGEQLLEVAEEEVDVERPCSWASSMMRVS